MNILLNLNETINLNKLNRATSTQIINSFFANYLAMLVMLRTNDIKGLKLINDPSHAMLTKFSSQMSDLNFWGRAVFNSMNHEVKNRIGNLEAVKLHKLSTKISTSRIQKMMEVPLNSSDFTNWYEVVASCVLASQVLELNSSYFKSTIRYFLNWDDLNSASQRNVIYKSIMFLTQSDPTSKLLPHMKRLLNVFMLNKFDKLPSSIVTVKEEDGGGEAGSSDSVSTGEVASTDNAILDQGAMLSRDMGGLYKLIKLADKQVSKKSKFKFVNGKPVKKRIKKFKSIKWKIPTNLKPQKDK